MSVLELCISGDLFFLSGDFSDSQFDQIEQLANQYFNGYTDVEHRLDSFTSFVSNHIHIQLILLRITHVIAI